MKITNVSGRNYPNEILQLLENADSLIDQRREGEAHAIYSKVISLYPKESYAYSMRGWLEEKKGEYAAAIIDLNEAIKHRPDIPNSIWLRANCYEKTGEINRAINDYKDYLKYKPEDADAYINLGLLYEYKKNYSTALIFYKKSLHLRRNKYIEDKIKILSIAK
jgi:tetratricopeptide (TPR) repeat protein